MSKGIRVIRSIAGKRLPDELLRPIPYNPAVGQAGDDRTTVNGREELFAERRRRLDVLAKHAGARFDRADEGRYALEYTLMRLVTEYVPGFRTTSPLNPGIGRPTTWTFQTKVDLVLRVDKLIVSGEAKTSAEACSLLVARREFQGGGQKGTTARSLAKRLSEARSDPEVIEAAYGKPFNILSGFRLPD